MRMGGFMQTYWIIICYDFVRDLDVHRINAEDDGDAYKRAIEWIKYDTGNSVVWFAVSKELRRF